MTSSLEIWDAATLEHVGSHSFGINWGSLTWVDFHDGYWWMVFANYDQPYGPDRTPYGRKAATQLIKFTQDFRMVEAWTLPKALLDKFALMSNSGGSWGPDGFLYLTGHDLGELYKMRLPTSGSVLELVATIPIERARPGNRLGSIGSRRHLRRRPCDIARAAGGRQQQGRSVPAHAMTGRFDDLTI